MENIEREMLVNLSFGQAIQEWNKHNYKEAVNLFWKHVEDYPETAPGYQKQCFISAVTPITMDVILKRKNSSDGS
jgi:hypothetical protein